MIVDYLISASRQWPRVPAVRDGTRSLSYRALAKLSLVLRDIIERRIEGEHVGIMLPASGAFSATFLGTLWASRVAVPLNFLLSAEELRTVVEDSKIRRIVTIGHFRSIADRLPAKPCYLEQWPIRRMMLFKALRRVPPAPPVSEHETAVLLYTSGTTGAPRGVELTYRNLCSNVQASIAALRLVDRYRFLNVLPPFHVFGLLGGVLVPLAGGGSVYAVPRFRPALAIRTIAQHRVEVLLAIPSMYAAMLRTKSAKREDFVSVRVAISGGEPLPPNVHEEFLRRFGVDIWQGYGLTETSPVVAVCTPDLHRPDVVGKPIPQVEIRIVDETGRDLPAGQDGQILVHGPGVMKGYFHQTELTRQVIDSDGWFQTGDIGHLDSEGALAITGRVKEMLIVGGENVMAREIEAVLERHEGVAQAAVIGVADGLRGEVPVAFVLPRSDCEPTEAELRQFAKRALAGFKVPRRILIRPELPTGPTGKILKRRLRDLLENRLNLLPPSTISHDNELRA